MNAPEPIAPPRSKFVGGSDIPAILGCSPYVTPVELYVKKRTGAETPDNPVLRRGRMLEPYVRELYTEETGNGLLPSVFVVGPEPWMGANLDGVVATSHHRVFEAKTANPWTRKDWGEAGTDSIPVYYTAQVQWYLGITGFAVADLAALIGLDDFRVFHVEADAAIFAALVERAREFWRRVQEGDPPAPTNAEDVFRLFPQHTPGMAREATDADVEALAELRGVKDQIKALEAREDDLRLALTARIGEAESLELAGKTLATWKAQESRRIDVTLLRQSHPALAEQFERVGRSRVFRIK